MVIITDIDGDVFSNEARVIFYVRHYCDGCGIIVNPAECRHHDICCFPTIFGAQVLSHSTPADTSQVEEKRWRA